MFNVKERMLFWVTAVTVAFHGTSSLLFFDETSSLWFGLLSLFAPFAITVVMVMRPKRFRQQLALWLLGTGMSVLVSAGFIFVFLAFSGISIWEAILTSLFIGSLSGTVGSLLFSSLAFFSGCFFNLFQKKPALPPDIQSVFQ